ncbi:MAG: OmpA family protein [Candidatus Cyclonatronum sp.]|uniref:OmpA family protein n=1 Tax=Cyclonatronum sp. TaxID=3024185 RepID=UPI0025BF696D|nr:OmpA family protein [Cyclonatronum sp.]MCH8487431.1 OmpA family protein [Cyclonatronum sp.]
MRTLSAGTFLKLGLIFSLLFAVSCNNIGRGALIGAGAGAGVGAVAGAILGDTAKGAIIGAAVGGAAGAIIGSQMDRQARELSEEIEGASIERVGEAIAIKFDSGLLFGFDSAQLSPTARGNLQSLAESLDRFDNTDIVIIGHTDNVGSATYNLGLSERRATSAADYLASLGVERGRLVVEGRGLTEPIADNATDEGRALNRRIEVVIVASDTFREEVQE